MKVRVGMEIGGRSPWRRYMFVRSAHFTSCSCSSPETSNTHRSTRPGTGSGLLDDARASWCCTGASASAILDATQGAHVPAFHFGWHSLVPHSPGVRTPCFSSCLPNACFLGLEKGLGAWATSHPPRLSVAVISSSYTWRRGSPPPSSSCLQCCFLTSTPRNRLLFDHPLFHRNFASLNPNSKASRTLQITRVLFRSYNFGSRRRKIMTLEYDFQIRSFRVVAYRLPPTTIHVVLQHPAFCSVTSTNHMTRSCTNPGKGTASWQVLVVR